MSDSIARETYVSAGFCFRTMLGSFGFDTVEDQRNAAVCLAGLAPFVSSQTARLIIINGDGPACGKTLLAHLIADSFGQSITQFDCPQTDGQWRTTLMALLKLDRSHIALFDGVSSLRNSLLQHFVTTQRWECRALHSRKVEKLDNDAVIIMTGDNLSIGADFCRRATIINLKGRGASK